MSGNAQPLNDQSIADILALCGYQIVTLAGCPGYQIVRGDDQRVLADLGQRQLRHVLLALDTGFARQVRREAAGVRVLHCPGQRLAHPGRGPHERRDRTWTELSATPDMWYNTPT